MDLRCTPFQIKPYGTFFWALTARCLDLRISTFKPTDVGTGWWLEGICSGKMAWIDYYHLQMGHFPSMCEKSPEGTSLVWIPMDMLVKSPWITRKSEKNLASFEANLLQVKTRGKLYFQSDKARLGRSWVEVTWISMFIPPKKDRTPMNS